MEEPVRINRYLAQAGVGSRRAVEALVLAGRVTVNGAVVESLAARVTVTDHVEVDGGSVSAEGLVHLLLHKPVGVVTTARDTHGRRTVLDLVRRAERVFPVGRLDVATSGALVLTNDGELAHRLMHPSSGVPKVYEASVRGAVGEDALRALREGVLLDDGPTAPATARVLRRGEGLTVVELTLHEGRKRQVRRMLEAVGHPVVELRRVAFGPLRLGGLKPGAARRLTAKEVAELNGARTGRSPSRGRSRRPARR